MKAILPLGLLAAVCFVAAGTASGTTTPTAAENKREATRVAARLLKLFVPPPGAVRAQREPRGDGGLLRRQPFSLTGRSVNRHGFWQVPRSLDFVVAFVKTHPPPGSRQESGGRDASPGAPANRFFDFELPQASSSRPARWIVLNAVALRRGSTGIRVDANAGWIVPRSPREKVPPGVREIDIHASHFSARVTKPVKAQNIVRWFDALGIVQGGPPVYCPNLRGTRVTLDFRSASRALLAQAVLSTAISTECDPIQFSIHSRAQTPLVGGRFWNRVKRLVGITGR